MSVKFIRFAAIVLLALVMGLAFAHVLEQPAKMQYDAVLYLTLQKSLYAQWGPPHIGGLLEPLAIAAAGLLAFFARKDKREFCFALGALTGLLLAFPLVFFWLVAPANAGFAAASLATIPRNWMELRSRWELGHAIRFALQFVALVLLLLPLVLRVTTQRVSDRVRMRGLQANICYPTLEPKRAQVPLNDRQQPAR